MKQAVNVVNIEGILNEVDLRVDVDPSNREYIRGKVIFIVNHTVSGKPEEEEIKVDVFSYRLTKLGKDNPAFMSAYRLMNEGISVAACGDRERADRYRISGASISSSEFDTQDGRHVIHYPIRASFFNKVTGTLNPTATFEQEIVISSIIDEIIDDTPSGRLVVTGVVVGYNDRVDTIPYIVEDVNAVNYIRTNWYPDSTVKIYGKIRSTVDVSTQTVVSEVGFGEAPSHTTERKTTRKEFIITSGSPQGYDTDMAYNIDEVRAALLKKKNQASKTTPSAHFIQNNRGF